MSPQDMTRSTKAAGYCAAIMTALLLQPGMSGAAEWPGGADVAVTLSFDLDAETVWWDDPETMTGEAGPLSQGRYGPRVALPKILALLERHDLEATFSEG